MAISFKNYHAKNQNNNNDNLTQILIGSSQGTIVKSLQVINGDQSCTLHVIRKDEGANTYADVRIDLKANDYLILWQGFFIIPYNHTLNFSCTSLNCTMIANVVELT